MYKPLPVRSNTANRENLIETARKLFYKQGYQATTLSQISEISNINNGLITYYFGSKSNLASVIYTTFLLDFRNEIARQLFEIKKGYKLELGITMETRCRMAINFKNPNVRRFNVEYSKERDLYANPVDKREHYYQLQKRLINPELSDEDLKLYEVCGLAVAEDIIKAYDSNYLGKDEEHIKNYVVRLILSMLQLPQHYIELLIEESEILENKLHINIDEDFQVSRY